MATAAGFADPEVKDDVILTATERAEQDQKAGIGPRLRFCPHSNDLMYAREDHNKRQLVYYCRTTGYEEEADDSCISRMVIRHSVKERTLVLGDMQNDPTLARSTDVQCANCGAREAVFKQEPTLQGMDLYFQCVQCRHEWAERGS